MNGSSGKLRPAQETYFTFSQTSLQDYLDCPRRFQLRYIEDALWPAVEAEPLDQVETRQREALLFHRLVQQHFLGMPREALTAAATSKNLARWWKNFSAAALDLDGWKLQTEKTLNCRIRQYRLVCKYDLLAVRDGKALIYDWKTFARRPANESLAARTQTRAYRAMLVQAGAELNAGQPFAPTDVSMIYWFAEFPDDPAVFSYDNAQYQRDWQTLNALVGEIGETKAFPLTPDLQQCRFCTYRSFCDRGRIPGTDAEYESESVSADSPGGDAGQVGEIQS
jgi:hypothetical protein